MDKLDLIHSTIVRGERKNAQEHGEIKEHLTALNGSVANIKTKQLAITFCIIGILLALTALGYLPEQIIKLAKYIF